MGTIQNQPAPITRSAPGMMGARINTMTPIAGVMVRSDAGAVVQQVSATGDVAELRLEKGRATVQVHHPAGKATVTVDLPGGHVDLLKDGLYTFNAETNTVRTLRGEADAYTDAASKGVKVKEEHELTFAANGKLKSIDAYPGELTADLVPGPAAADRGYAGGGYGAGYAPFGEGYPYAYPYPYYAYGYPYGFYPYGYPFGFGLGIGYYGGFGGGFRGGFRR